jgi:GINS complex subunit 3
MEDDYWSIEAILAENQVGCWVRSIKAYFELTSYQKKIQCTFKLEVPDLGYLEGGEEQNVRFLH